MSIIDETSYDPDRDTLLDDLLTIDENGHLEPAVVIGLIVLASLLVGLLLVFMDAVL